MPTNNPPAAILELTQDEADFLVRNCDSNITLGLELLQEISSPDLARELVHNIEMFKRLKAKVTS